MKKKVLILTKSAKRRHDGTHYGFCIAGITKDSNDNLKWVRLVADKSGDSILEDDFPFKPLDVIEANLYPCPNRNHIENYTYDNLTHITTINIDQLKNIFKSMPHSFFGSMSNIYDGEPDHSLTFFLARDLHIYRDNAGSGPSKVDFKIGNNAAGNVSMTDYEFMPKKFTNETTDIPCAICIASLPNNPPYYKFIASIFPIDSF